MILFIFIYRILKGVTTRSHILNRLLNDNLPITSTIDRFIFKQFRKVQSTINLGRVSRILEREPFVVVIHFDTVNDVQVEKVDGIITKEKFLDYLLTYSQNDKPKNGF